MDVELLKIKDDELKFRLSASLKKDCKAIAKKLGISLPDFARAALINYVTYNLENK